VKTASLPISPSLEGDMLVACQLKGNLLLFVFFIHHGSGEVDELIDPASSILHNTAAGLANGFS
jgi:hypothetical protein